MGASQGLLRIGNRGGQIVLSLTTAAAAVATPLTGYGIIGTNDSGAVCFDGEGFDNWSIQMVQVGGVAPVGYGVTVYDTLDSSLFSLAYPNVPNSNFPLSNAGYAPQKGTTVIPAFNWAPSSSPSEQGGTGVVANPITPTSPKMLIKYPVVALRFVLTTVGTAGACNILVAANP